MIKLKQDFIKVKSLSVTITVTYKTMKALRENSDQLSHPLTQEKLIPLKTPLCIDSNPISAMLTTHYYHFSPAELLAMM